MPRAAPWATHLKSQRLLLAPLLALLVPNAVAFRRAMPVHGYVLVSSPSEVTIYYSVLPSPEERSQGKQLAREILVAGGELVQPEGLAVDAIRRVLYVADPGSSSVLAFRLMENKGPTPGLYADAPQVVLNGVEVHWIAVDSQGTLFCVDAGNNRILSLPGRSRGFIAEEANVLYEGGSTQALKAPEGIAVDGGYIFWVNSQNGQSDGVLVRAPEDDKLDSRASELFVLAKNADKGAGVCLTGSRIVFSDGSKIFSSSINGDDIVEVTAAGQAVRGCAFDGDGTVYLTDKTQGMVLGFSGSGSHISQRGLMPAMAVAGADGIAIFGSSSSTARSMATAGFGVAGLLALLSVALTTHCGI